MATGKFKNKKGDKKMNMVKTIFKSIFPIVLVVALLTTMNVFKRTDTLKPDEKQKIKRYTYLINK
jgi:gamma-polyglutamate biosynthesis protein CapE